MTRSEKPVGEGREAMRVWLLGGFRVAIGDRPIQRDAWRLKKVAALVKLLALAPGHRLHREQIMDLLWPDSGRGAASNSLRKTLHYARKVFEPYAGSRYLASEFESLVLCPGGDLRVDAEAFEEAVTTARRSQDPATHRAAIELYAGDLLPEDRYEEWTEPRREELQQLYLGLLVELAALYEGRHQYDPAIEVLRKAVAEEPTNEAAHLGLMRAYALLGRKTETLAQFERLKGALSTHLGAEPGVEATGLRGELVAGTFPPTHDQAATPLSEQPNDAKHNLPAPRDSFVGRNREFREIKRELAMTRLLTLTGPGGSGKTRLALEVARDLVGAYPDGVWMVELAPLTEGALVPQAVAGVLRIKEQSHQRLTDTLIETLRAKNVLVVLDNCEHLVDAAASLVDVLLSSCSRLRILATSREPLGVAGEINWVVPPLSVPTRGLPTVEQLGHYEATRLFMLRASSKRSTFSLKPENTRAVVEICRRLDGIPLAIELAAARVGSLSVEQLSEKLDDSIELLTGGKRTAVPRQRTLAGALDWSHDLLGEPEQTLFRRLSVFAGGFTLTAAENVGSGDAIYKDDVLEMLSGLVDKSLVTTEMASDERLRYGLLEPVRQYASLRLEESQEAEAVRRRHAEFFLTLADEAVPNLRGQDQAAWFARLETEHDNLRVALSWAIERGEEGAGLRLGGALWRFWLNRNRWNEGRTWLEAGLARDEGSYPALRAKALAGAAQLALNQADYEHAAPLIEESLALYRKYEDNNGIAIGLNLLGWLALQQGNYDRATELLEESLKRFQTAGRTYETVSPLSGLAAVASSKGDHDQSTALVEQVPAEDGIDGRLQPRQGAA